MTLLEICVDSVAGARIAQDHGADRVELCAGLSEGGMTPSIGTINRSLAALDRIAVHVLIRPRGGGFTYDADEIATMSTDIAAVTALPRRAGLGFVVNAISHDGHIDTDVLGVLLPLCTGHPVTFSRAFDYVADQFAALDTLADLGVHRVLTGGGRGTADEGVDRLAALVEHAAGRIAILAAGGIRAHNVAQIVAATGVGEVHLRAPEADGQGTSGAQIDAVRAALGLP